MTSRWAAAVALALAVAPEVAATQLRGPSPALVEAAHALALQIQAAHPEPPVALAVSAASPALADAFSTLLASALAAQRLGPQVLRGRAADAESAARATGARSLVRIQVTVGETVDVRGDLLGTWVNFWSGHRATRPPAPAAALAVAVPSDPAALALARPAEPRWALVLEPAALAELPARTAALAAGDLDGDGAPELVALTDDEVLVLDVHGSVRARHPLAPLAPSEAPAREPFGTLCVDGGRLTVFSARRRAGEVLVLRGEMLAPGGPAPASPTLGCGARALPARFEPGAARLILPGAPGLRLWGGGVREDARLELRPDGTARWSDAHGSRSVPGVGAGAALADLAERGGPLLAASGAGVGPTDRLRLLAVVGVSAVERASVEVPGRILQVVPVDLDGDERLELLLGVWDGQRALLRVVRSGP